MVPNQENMKGDQPVQTHSHTHQPLQPQTFMQEHCLGETVLPSSVFQAVHEMSLVLLFKVIIQCGFIWKETYAVMHVKFYCCGTNRLFSSHFNLWTFELVPYHPIRVTHEVGKGRRRYGIRGATTSDEYLKEKLPQAFMQIRWMENYFRNLTAKVWTNLDKLIKSYEFSKFWLISCMPPFQVAPCYNLWCHNSATVYTNFTNFYWSWMYLRPTFIFRHVRLKIIVHAFMIELDQSDYWKQRQRKTFWISTRELIDRGGRFTSFLLLLSVNVFFFFNL